MGSGWRVAAAWDYVAMASVVGLLALTVITYGTPLIP